MMRGGDLSLSPLRVSSDGKPGFPVVFTASGASPAQCPAQCPARCWARCITRLTSRATDRTRDLITERTTGHADAFMKEPAMHQIIYIVGAIVLVIALLSFVGLR